jgi:hypothetical protein
MRTKIFGAAQKILRERRSRDIPICKLRSSNSSLHG